MNCKGICEITAEFVVCRIMAPAKMSTCRSQWNLWLCSFIWQRVIEVVDETKDANQHFKIGSYPVLSGWAHYNHKGPLKQKRGRREGQSDVI